MYVTVLTAARLTFLSKIQPGSALTELQQPLNFEISRIRTAMQYFIAYKQSNAGPGFFPVTAICSLHAQA